MFEAQSISAEHKDLIHDVAYDFYGERMATCSSDQYVKIFDSDGMGSWQLSASWKAHHGSVWKVTWAHPEFGQVIATCSFDRTAAVWEEVGDTTVPGTERGLRQWVKRSNLVDSRTSVTDVKFGPKNLGLLLVTCSADGIIRIYEAPDVMNLSQWTLQHEIPIKVSISCLSWNPSLSRINPPMIAIGSDEPNHPASTVVVDKSTNPHNGKVYLYEYSDGARRWTRSDCLPCVAEPVHDLAFAPNLGRTFHLLAIASKDVRIIKIEPIADGASVQNGGSTRFKCEVMAAFDDHCASVWRVCWNVTGTILASSGDDCFVRLWKMQYLNQWKSVAVLKSERGGSAGGGGAGTSSSTGPVGAADSPPPSALRPPNAFVKLAAITYPNQVPWH